MKQYFDVSEKKVNKCSYFFEWTFPKRFHQDTVHFRLLLFTAQFYLFFYLVLVTANADLLVKFKVIRAIHLLIKKISKKYHLCIL
jgi:hypothetical protein